MTGRHTGAIFGWVFAVAALAAIVTLFAGTSSARALCIENKTDTRLIFTARVKGEAEKGLVFRQWIEGGARACQKDVSGSAIWEVFVFASEDSIEGCDDEAAGDQTLQLQIFAEFDNCVWGKPD